MTIPKITPYTGGVANPDGSQTQTEFTQNMFDQLSYEAGLSTELNSTVDGINDTAIQVDADATSAAQSASAAEAAASGLNYKGLWPDTGGSANKGDTYQTQVSGTPTGQYFTALQNTTVDPVGDDVNWRSVVSFSSITGVNLISNASFEIAGGVTNQPDITPRDYLVGDELFQGVFAAGALTGVTYVDGILNGTGQLYTDAYKSEKQKLSTVAHVASTASSDGMPVESGASFVDSGDYWRVTFDMNDTFSVKLEQGSVATRHEIEKEQLKLTKSSINDLISVVSPFHGQTETVSSYHSGFASGGGTFSWDSNRSKTDHDGGIVIDPDITYPNDWSNVTQQEAWFTAATSGSGCWVRIVETETVNTEWYGVKPNVTDDLLVENSSIPIQSAVDSIFKRNAYGGSASIPAGKVLTDPPINPYKYALFDINGDPTIAPGPRNVKPTMRFYGQGNTLWKAANGSSCIKPESAILPAYYDLFCFNIRFIGDGNTGTPLDIQRNLASPVNIKLYWCVSSGFDDGIAYLPFTEAGTNPRNGFIGLFSCNFYENNRGLHIDGCDNVDITDSTFEKNFVAGHDISNCVVMNMRGGKLQYNGDINDDTTGQVKLGGGTGTGTVRNVKYDNVYLEGGASATEADNAGKGLASVLIEGSVTSLSFSGYMNGLKSEAPFRLAGGKIFSIDVAADILNYQLDADLNVFQLDGASSAGFSYLINTIDNIRYGNMYDSGGALLTEAPRFKIERTFFNDVIYTISPQVLSGTLSLTSSGSGATSRAASIVFNIEGGAGEGVAAFLGTAVELSTFDLNSTPGNTGKITVSFATSSIQIQNRLGSNVKMQAQAYNGFN